MKKLTILLSLTIVGSALLFALAGCGGDSSSKSSETAKTTAKSTAAVETTTATTTATTEAAADDMLTGDGFTMELADGWTKTDDAIAIAPDSSSNITIVAEELPSAMSAKDYATASLQAVTTLFPDIAVEGEAEYEVGSYDGYALGYTMDIGGMEMQYMQFYVTKDKVGYVITFTALDVDTYQEDVEAMLATFTLK